MLAATMPTTSNAIQEHSPNSPAYGMQDRLCPGCKQSAVTEDGGLVVAFGSSFFHVDCFRCAKCGDQVTADTNLLLLSDGSPICANCSYSCSVCHEPILDEAIMTGEDSYHAHCFKCKVCKKRIEELVFARTSQGIYCMDCHNERMIKIRRHAQKKAEKERSLGSSSSRSREHAAQEFHRENGRASPAYPHSARSPDRPSTSRSHTAGMREALIDNSRPGSSRSVEGPNFRSPKRLYVEDAFESSASAANSPRHDTVSPSSPTIAVTVAPPAPEALASKPNFNRRTSYLGQGLSNNASSSELLPRATPNKNNTLPIPSAEEDSNKSQRRKSYDDGVRPLNILFSQNANGNPGVRQESEGPGGLNPPPTSRRDKRRSINPGLVLGEAGKISGTPPTGLLSPISVTFGGASGMRPVTPPSVGQDSPRGQDDPHTSWPDSQSSRRSTSTSITSEQWRDASSQFSRPSSANDSHDARSSDSHARPGRSSFTSSLNLRNSRSNSRSRPNSPGHQADVPHSVESGTDTEAEAAEEEVTALQGEVPPAPPPKEDQNLASSSSGLRFDLDSAAPASAQHDSESEDLSESSPIQTSHTFIAPALPPIRFSLPADFSDLLTAVGGVPALKALDNLTSVPENNEAPSTPPPTATSITSNGTSTSSASTIVASGRDPHEMLGSLSSAHGSMKGSASDKATSVDNINGGTDVIADYSQISALSPGKSPSTVLPPHSLSQTTSKLASGGLVNGVASPKITITESDHSSTRPRSSSGGSDMIISRLQEILTDTQQRGAQQLKLDKPFVEAILAALESKRTECADMKSRLDGMKRESRQYIEGLTVAQTEYDKELKARRDAEAEVTRLRVLLSGQAARLTALSEETRRQELRQQMTKELNENLTGLEQNLSKLRVERDMTLAEVEELSMTKSSTDGNSETPPVNLGRSLTKRLDNIKSQYQRELIPLKEQKEALAREIAELKAVRDVFLEETTVLNARNEELAQLSTQYSRRMDSLPETPPKSHPIISPSRPRGSSLDKTRPLPHAQQHPTPSNLILAPSVSAHNDDGADAKFVKVQKLEMDIPTPSGKKFKWPGAKARELVSAISMSDNGARSKARSEHTFQQINNMRFTRCDHCGDKMWGSQLRCSGCSISVHVRCVNLVTASCSQQTLHHRDEPVETPPLSMFGRDLSEQVRADAKGTDRQVPVIVEKCIAAVELLALDYEGIYRKTGGSSHTKAITQLFERGNYDSFDLTDSERFNDICSVTSVLKTYFRSLPIPLLTYDLHESFMSAIQLRDPATKSMTLIELINQLPSEHYHTLRLLMLHLHRVCEHSERNLMNARNLGVVFGPTLMRSPDPNAEFSDMAGKALSVEWLVENAPLVFGQSLS